MIDIGANLAHDSFDHDRQAVMARAAAASIVQMVITGTSVAGSSAAAELAADHPGVLYATAGMHPHHAGEFDDDATGQFRQLAGLPQVVAVGECGLDHFRNFSTPAEQEHAFLAQLELAVELQLPVFLHQRDAHETFITIVREYRDRISAAVAHCFTGSKAELYDCLDLDLHIGVTGWICDERRGHDLQEAVAGIPPGRLMIETDAPYLLPRDLEPKPKTRRNEPMHLPHILAAVARHSGRDFNELARETTATAREFFKLGGA
ncbi:MAG: hydrolase TatD [Gammaproteobacteria bacterium]|nr:hydrolase TatD [Gammaproteobacteria bacterium]NNM19920.1 hydrolase TatD [Gammaproteobacteria bacterium]